MALAQHGQCGVRLDERRLLEGSGDVSEGGVAAADRSGVHVPRGFPRQ
jgi:hypothetical protein